MALFDVQSPFSDVVNQSNFMWFALFVLVLDGLLDIFGLQYTFSISYQSNVPSSLFFERRCMIVGVCVSFYVLHYMSGCTWFDTLFR